MGRNLCFLRLVDLIALFCWVGSTLLQRRKILNSLCFNRLPFPSLLPNHLIITCLRKTRQDLLWRTGIQARLMEAFHMWWQTARAGWLPQPWAWLGCPRQKSRHHHCTTTALLCTSYFAHSQQACAVAMNGPRAQTSNGKWRPADILPQHNRGLQCIQLRTLWVSLADSTPTNRVTLGRIPKPLCFPEAVAGIRGCRGRTESPWDDINHPAFSSVALLILRLRGQQIQVSESKIFPFQKHAH